MNKVKPSLCVFTTGTDFRLLSQSCSAVNITLNTYLVMNWKGYVHGKIEEALKFLQGRDEPYVMWVDGNDSLIFKRSDDILSRVRALDFPLLIAAEHTCWPMEELAKHYPKTPLTPNAPRFINSGGYIGTRDVVMTMLHQVLRAAQDLGTQDDQLAWTKAYISGSLDAQYFQIDHGRWVFSSIGDGDAALKADSCVKHWNGRIPGRDEYYLNYRKRLTAAQRG